ncbi:very short patch repair endonuclease [Cellulomonas sp.]|uniref:very short patch repair endonuclease n=1 Tax=Cellulomonas sp. TaxID=40001 RepID=UPI0034575F6C
MEQVAPHPGASSPSVSERMSAARRRDTKPELDVRRILHARGLRYRVNYPVPGLPRRTIDIAFTRSRIAIFLDGCFWHGCPEHGTQPRANSDWWLTKLRRNVVRDTDTNHVLESAGWRVLRYWEHEEAWVIADEINAVVRGLDRPAEEIGVGHDVPSHHRPRTQIP